MLAGSVIKIPCYGNFPRSSDIYIKSRERERERTRVYREDVTRIYLNHKYYKFN